MPEPIDMSNPREESWDEGWKDALDSKGGEAPANGAGPRGRDRAAMITLTVSDDDAEMLGSALRSLKLVRDLALDGAMMCSADRQRLKDVSAFAGDREGLVRLHHYIETLLIAHGVEGHGDG